MQIVLRKVVAVASAAMLVATLSAIAVVRADKRTNLAASSATALGNGNGSTGAADDGSATDPGAATDPSQAAGPALSGPAAAATSGSAATGGTATGSSAGGASTSTGGSNSSTAPGAHLNPQTPYPNTSTNCPDYNPTVGVFCDHFLVGGTTVLSGPLAVYGDQGLKGGLAWINYFNQNVAPKERLRTAKLIWYDDNLDPNKTLQYVQRLNEVDHVLYLGGVTSPESISPYLEQKKFPMLGDIGLSPKSYTNRYIFATAPSEQTRNPIRIKTAVERLGIKSFSVIQDVLPSVDTTPIKQSWQNAAKQFGVEEKGYVEIASTASDCSAQFRNVASTKPDYLIMPTASSVLLACLREAQAESVKPNSNTTPWLKGWSGGSNLQIEVDNCKPYCEGLYSIGTVFNDPRVSTTPQMQIYRQNMAKYAPNVDMTGFIAINYYHAGYVFYSMLKAKGIQDSLTRENIVSAAEHFGPFDTGFGNQITWTTTLPRVPWTCGYPVQVKGDHWVFDTNKVCL
jgi:hypothetical protein